MSDDTLRDAKDELLRVCGFDTERAAQHVAAVAEVIRRLVRSGGGCATLEITGYHSGSGKFSLESPKILVAERFHLPKKA